MKVKLTESKSGYTGEKRLSLFTGKNKVKAITAICLLVAFTVTFILSSVGVIPLDAAVLRLRVAITGTDDRFPLQVNSDSVLSMDILGKNIIILTTDSLCVYSENGKELFIQPHSYAKPGISINGEKAVAFDRGGKGFMLIDKDEVVYSGEADNTIISAEYGKNGTYALGTKSNNATTELIVFNKKHDVKFQWQCAYDYISQIALSNNGKFIGVAVVGAENGEVFSSVSFFGVDYKETLNTQKIKGASPIDLKFSKNDSLTLFSDTGVYLIHKKAENYTSPLTYYSSEFHSCDSSEKGDYVVTLSKYGSKSATQTTVFNKKGEVRCTITSDFTVKDVRISSKYVFVLGENIIYVYNLSGKRVSEITYKGKAKGILPTDNFIFISSLDKISRCFSYGNSTVEL